MVHSYRRISLLEVDERAEESSDEDHSFKTWKLFGGLFIGVLLGCAACVEYLHHGLKVLHVGHKTSLASTEVVLSASTGLTVHGSLVFTYGGDLSGSEQDFVEAVEGVSSDLLHYDPTMTSDRGQNGYEVQAFYTASDISIWNGFQLATMLDTTQSHRRLFTIQSLKTALALKGFPGPVSVVIEKPDFEWCRALYIDMVPNIESWVDDWARLGDAFAEGVTSARSFPCSPGTSCNAVFNGPVSVLLYVSNHAVGDLLSCGSFRLSVQPPASQQLDTPSSWTGGNLTISFGSVQVIVDMGEWGGYPTIVTSFGPKGLRAWVGNTDPLLGYGAGSSTLFRVLAEDTSITLSPDSSKFQDCQVSGGVFGVALAGAEVDPLLR